MRKYSYVPGEIKSSTGLDSFSFIAALSKAAVSSMWHLLDGMMFHRHLNFAVKVYCYFLKFDLGNTRLSQYFPSTESMILCWTYCYKAFFYFCAETSIANNWLSRCLISSNVSGLTRIDSLVNLRIALLILRQLACNSFVLLKLFQFSFFRSWTFVTLLLHISMKY